MNKLNDNIRHITLVILILASISATVIGFVLPSRPAHAQSGPTPTATPKAGTVEDDLRQAKAALQKRDFNQAILLLDKALTKKPKYLAALVLRGYVHFLRSEQELAAKDFTTASDLIPTSADEFVSRAEAFRWLGKVNRSVEDLNAAVALSPKDPNLLATRGQYQLLASKPDQALNDADSALKLDSKSIDAYFLRGSVFESQGKYELAAGAMTSVIAISPTMAAAYNNRGWFYAQAGKGDLAVKDCLSALKLRPDSPAQFDTCGLAYFAKGDYLTSLAYYDKGIAMAPGAPMATSYCRRGQVNQKLNKRNDAIKDYKQCLDLNRSPDLVKVATDGLNALGAQ